MFRTITVTQPSEIHSTIEGLLHDSTRDRNLPWWEIVRIEGSKGTQSAVVIRIDHVIGDGISLVNLMEQILEGEELRDEGREEWRMCGESDGCAA